MQLLVRRGSATIATIVLQVFLIVSLLLGEFFPDEHAALKEMRRVLASEGRIILSVWDGASDFFKALANAIAEHVDKDIARQSLAPFSYVSTESLPRSLNAVGFENILVQPISVDIDRHNDTNRGAAQKKIACWRT